MITDSEKWHNDSDENQAGANERGYNKAYDRENKFNSYNFQNEGNRSYYGGNRVNNNNRGERPQRQRFTRGTDAASNGVRPRFTRVNTSETSYNPRFSRQQRPYGNGSETNEARQYRSSYNGGSSYGNRNYGNQVTVERPRFNANSYGEERTWKSNGYGRNDERTQRKTNGFGNRSQQGGGMRRRTEGYNPNAKYSRKKQIEYKDILTDPNEPIRLNKYLANAGICSRREADEFIAAGVVSVNGVVVTELGTKVLRTDTIKFHDETVSAERKVYILLNKPKDCVTTSDDPQERKTVLDLVKGACSERIYPVGRLDRNTTGVLLLTNDGDLASKLTHPKYLKKKIYHVYCDKNVTKADLDQIAAGITLDDGEIHADAISYASETDKSQVGIEIHSGKNRIVRRIFESLGYRVTKLDRVFFAGLTKKNLRRGDWRFLTEQEVNMLRMGAFE